MGASGAKNDFAKVEVCCGGPRDGGPGCSGPGPEAFCFPDDGFDFDSMGFASGSDYGGMRVAPSSWEDLDVHLESMETLRRRLSNIAEAEEDHDLKRAQAYEDVLCRVLDLITTSMRLPAPGEGCDLHDVPVQMIVVAPQEDVQELVRTPDVLVLTQQPAATSVYDDRFATMLSQLLCRNHESAYLSRSRREASSKHIAVSHTSGEILATSAVFMPRAPPPSGLMAMAAVGGLGNSEAAWAGDGHETPLGAVAVAATLTRGVVFATFERGGVAVLPVADVARGRAFKLALP